MRKPKETVEQAPPQIEPTPMSPEDQILQLKATGYELISERERITQLLAQVNARINTLMRG